LIGAAMAALFIATLFSGSAAAVRDGPDTNHTGDSRRKFLC